MRCRFCDGDASEPGHRLRCDGRQGALEFDRSDETPLPLYEPFTHARPSDPDTSLAAALAVDATEVQQRVYAIHKTHPAGLTDEELVALYARAHPAGRSLESRSSPRKRRSDLTNAGILVDSGQRRVLTSGRNGVVWVIARADQKQAS